MAYKVIALKFRPQTFEEVIGQQHVTRTLKNAVSEGRIAHAFLFSGERGVGKTSVARILAKALNCREGTTVNPCGVCASCAEITAGNCLDVNEIDGASNTGVDDIRALRENTKYLPSRDRYKIYIIDEVHMLSTSAFNALLKTLEEPPEHVIFMFATTEPQKIPDTILSRCLRFDFKRISTKQVVEHLENICRGENIQISRRGLSLIARESDGSMRDAQTILERAISYCGGQVKDADLEELLGYIDRQFIYRIMEAVLAEDLQGSIAGLNEVYTYGVDLRRFYYGFLEHLRDLMMLKAANDASKLVDAADEDLKTLEKFSKRITADELQKCFRLWFSAEGEIVRSAVPKIALEVCLLEMISLKKTIPLDDILSRIDGLQKQIERAAEVPVNLLPSFQAKKEYRQDVAGKEKTTDSISRLNQGDQNDNAGAFLAFVRKKHPPIASILGHGKVEIRHDSVVEIELPPGSFFIEKMKEGETEKKLRGLCQDFFHKEMEISIVASNEKKNLKPKNENDFRRKKALENPIIEKILKTFNGTIVNIRTDI